MTLRYIVKTPTDVYGHYAMTATANKAKAIQLAAQYSGFVLDTFVRVGAFGYKIVFDATK